MTSKILNWLKRHDRQRIIMDRINDAPYLERYYLFLKDRGEHFPFNIFLHHFLRSDPDHVHDHPWPYFTIILRGGYWEWQPITDDQGQVLTEIAVWRGAGHFRWSPASSFHRVELDPNVDCWSLFIPGIKQQEWGFWFQRRWVQWQEYLNLRQQKI